MTVSQQQQTTSMNLSSLVHEIESSAVERVRALNEERQRILVAMADLSVIPRKTKREKINTEHAISQLSAQYNDATKKLLNFYENKEMLFAQEFRNYSGQGTFAKFMQKISTLKDKSTKHSNSSSAQNSTAYKSLAEDFHNLSRNQEAFISGHPIEFSYEEAYGHYLDLNGHHFAYNNLMIDDESISYLDYLQIIDRLYEIPASVKQTKKYEGYLNGLSDYLLDFVRRAKPLIDFEQNDMPTVEKEFETQWEKNSFIGWDENFLKQPNSKISQAKNMSKSNLKQKSEKDFDLDRVKDAKELENLGNEKLKNILSAMGLKCGGTLTQKAERLFGVKGKTIKELDSSFFPNVKKTITPEKIAELRQSLKPLALKEAIVYKLMELLSEERSETRNNVIRKQSMTAEERLNEQKLQDDADNLDEQSENGNYGAEDDDEEEEDEQIYNPKNLPLSWDGKPIPYWLYKLHGLNLNFSCEICGNHVYAGPKAFIRHFSEWRHSHGMKCLGIPNTAHFAYVTLIEDAITIWEKMCAERESATWKNDNEEFEDTNLNVITRKIYNDMYNQGYI